MEDLGSLYLRTVNDVYDIIINYLLRRIKRFSPKKMAVVFDIDETCICNMNITENGQSMYQKAFPGALKLYNLLVNLGIDVFFITARKSDSVQYTVNQLNELGFIQYKKLYMIPKDDPINLGTFKSNCRGLIDKDHNIIINVGDQCTDLGKYTEMNFLIPNPFYSTSKY